MPRGASGNINVPLSRLDRRTPPQGEAQILYLDGDFDVRRPGAFVRCAATNAQIPLEELRYWNVDRQEAYASPEAKLLRLKQIAESKK